MSDSVSFFKRGTEETTPRRRAAHRSAPLVFLVVRCSCVLNRGDLTAAVISV